MKTIDRDLEGWKPVGRGTPMPSRGWIFLKHPGKMPKAYLARHLPTNLDTTNMYWKPAGKPADF